MTRRPFLFPDPAGEIDVVIPVPSSVRPPERDYYRRAYVGILDRTGSRSEARQGAMSALQSARRLIKAERNPKNKPTIPPRPAKSSQRKGL